jgi:hypothetical protein
VIAPATGHGLDHPAAVVLAMAASAPLAGLGARLGDVGGIVPLPGVGSLPGSLLTAAGQRTTGLVGGIVLATSALLGLGAYACTRLRRMLARLW